ncbi:MAG: PEGA domain-containing protein [Candidatus Omnitrophica bacterium]|nr:PEGA domain-containing protein [Candidatus Omnitrophota bacterium]
MHPQKPIEKTGIISLSSLPSGAKIYINGKLYASHTPTILRDLKTGEYEITLTADKFMPWKKTVPVMEGQASVLEDILLIPKVWPKRIVTTRVFKKIIPVDEKALLLLPGDNTVQGIFVYRWSNPALSINLKNDNPASNEKIYPLFNAPVSPFPNELEDIFTMPESTHFLLKLRNTTDPEKIIYTWVDPLSTPASFTSSTDISALFTNPPDKIFWSNDDEDNIFTLNNNTVSRLDIKNQNLYPQIIKNIKGAGLRGRQIFVIDQSNHFNKFDYRQLKPETLTGDLDQLPKEFQDEQNYNIDILNDNMVVFLGLNGQLLWNNLPYMLIEQGCRGYLPVHQGRQIMVWTQNKIGIIDFTENRKEGIFETGPSVKWIIENGSDITQAFLVNRGSQILFKDGSKVNLTDTELMYNRDISLITTTESPIVYSDRAQKLFYLDDKNQQLNVIDILP